MSTSLTHALPLLSTPAARWSTPTPWCCRTRIGAAAIGIATVPLAELLAGLSRWDPRHFRR